MEFMSWSHTSGFVDYIHCWVYMELYASLIRFRSDNGFDFVVLSLDIAFYLLPLNSLCLLLKKIHLRVLRSLISISLLEPQYYFKTNTPKEQNKVFCTVTSFQLL